MADEKKITIAVPGEWALQKVFGPALGELGEDLKRLYVKGRDKLLSTAFRKVRDPDDGKQANLRVTRDVIWNGTFTEEEVCAEYFGGILASSRSKDGKDDAAIQFVDVIKSLSTKQLHLHYVVYNSLNKLLVATGTRVNVAAGQEFQPKRVWFSSDELSDPPLHLRIGTDLNVLHRVGLLHEYRTDFHRPDEQRYYNYTWVNPTTFGVLLYAAAHNKSDEWLAFDIEDFGNFPEVPLPTLYALTLEEVLKKAGFKKN